MTLRESLGGTPASPSCTSARPRTMIKSCPCVSFSGDLATSKILQAMYFDSFVLPEWEDATIGPQSSYSPSLSSQRHRSLLQLSEKAAVTSTVLQSKLLFFPTKKHADPQYGQEGVFDFWVVVHHDGDVSHVRHIADR